MIPNFVKETLTHCLYCLKPLNIDWEKSSGDFSIHCCLYNQFTHNRHIYTKHKMSIIFNVYNDLSSILQVSADHFSIHYILGILGRSPGKTSIYFNEMSASYNGKEIKFDKIIEIDFSSIDKIINKINLIQTFQ